MEKKNTHNEGNQQMSRLRGYNVKLSAKVD